MKDWYQCTKEEVLSRLDTTKEGLTQRQTQDRIRQYGPNLLKEAGGKPAWRVFLEQFQDLLVIILIGAAVISMITDNPESAVVIFAVITLNGILGTVQHEKARKSLESLRSLSAPMAVVMREGSKIQIPSKEVVPGDILYLESGDLVVADGRILESTALQINESSLTGESDAVLKQERILPGSLSIGDRSNMVYSSSLVTGGRGVAVVTATGMDTEIGRIASMMSSAEEKKTPLQISLDQFSSRLAAAIMVICLVVFGLSLYRGMAMLDSLMFAVALAVAAIPEALGSIVTIVQAMGTQKMAKEQAIIKDLKAVESLGCVSVICTDKTGTLTQNKMSVEHVALNGRLFPPSRLNQTDKQHRLFVEICALVNDAWAEEPETGQKNESGSRQKTKRKMYKEQREMGDATELALLRLAQAAGVPQGRLQRRFPRIREIPFDSVRKIMSTVHQLPQGPTLLTKGAMDILMERCTFIDQDGEIRPITFQDKRIWMQLHDTCSRQGLRVLALAYRPLKDHMISSGAKSLERELVFLGFAAMMDPPRPETREAVNDGRRAGIKPVMITGDHKVTAMAIAGQIGILKPGEEAVEGNQLDHMDGQELSNRIENISVYARVSPEHKLRIVKAWQEKGRIVAMTGDGVNDAPALKQADIGVAMGQTGTEVSKDAAAMILADDHFATIIKAVSNGRNVYRNIRNAIEFLLSGNMAGIFCVLYTTMAALPLPFAPVHLLFINLLTDSLPAIAIGMEQPEGELLNQPPRDPNRGILTKRFLRDILIQGGLIAVCTMYAYRTGLTQKGSALASTMAFATLTLARLFHGFNCRSSHSIFHLGLFSNLYTVMAFEAGVLLMAAVLFIPQLQTLFAVSDLTASQLLTVGICALAPTIVLQLWKVLREIRRGMVRR
ncbi:MAG: cation-translocating P-type ATPase [Hungatella sp.]|nr:cation-translocating P-type ATPase [Hungatella sp.]